MAGTRKGGVTAKVFIKSKSLPESLWQCNVQVIDGQCGSFEYTHTLRAESKEDAERKIFTALEDRLRKQKLGHGATSRNKGKNTGVHYYGFTKDLGHV